MATPSESFGFGGIIRLINRLLMTVNQSELGDGNTLYGRSSALDVQTAEDAATEAAQDTSESRYGLDSHFMLERAFEKNAEIHLLSFIEPVSAKKAIKFIDLKLKICDLLSTGISIAVGKVLLAEVRKTSNLPYECPLKGNVNYTFSNLSITAETLPTYTPFMKYNFSLITYDNKQMVAKFLLDGETVPK
uniref:Uncharacterized protein n=1 Tax=Stomoxys calcitrans TaxID=35570 RepID=A0A1I8PF67_STOCA